MQAPLGKLERFSFARSGNPRRDRKGARIPVGVCVAFRHGRVKNALAGRCKTLR